MTFDVTSPTSEQRCVGVELVLYMLLLSVVLLRHIAALMRPIATDGVTLWSVDLSIYM